MTKRPPTRYAGAVLGLPSFALAVCVVASFWVSPLYALKLQAVAIWLGGLVVFLAAIVYRHRMPVPWLLGPAAVLVFLGAVELGLRSAPWRNPNLPFGITGEFEANPYVFWLPKKQGGERDAGTRPAAKESGETAQALGATPYIDPNDLGFRSGPPQRDKPPGAYRILTMGGSNARG